MNWILGIGGYSHDASAALLCDGTLVAAVQEERLTRIKHIGGFPFKSIIYCLEAGGIKPEDISAIAFYAKKSNWDGYLIDAMKAPFRNIGFALANTKNFLYSVGFRTYKSLNFRAELERFLYKTGFNKKMFFFYDHHSCHAASAFYSSPFNEAIILCVDAGGDGKSTTMWVGKENELLTIEDPIKHPHSLGLLYGKITQFLGFTGAGDEYKVMGLAAYGRPAYFDSLKDMIKFEDHGYRLNMEYFNPYDYSLSDKFKEKFGPPRNPKDEITDHYANLAASLQRLYEEAVLHLTLGAKRQTGIKNLTIAGGAALNCKANGLLLASGEFDKIFVPAGASDTGTCIGAAQYHYHHTMKMPRHFTMKTDTWGPEYKDKEILEELNRSGLNYEVLSDPAHKAAELIASGKIIGWFQGRMEFGPRALGNRSILADPRKKDIKDRVNKTIKFREQFRPFAPSCLRDKVRDYFAIDVDSPFMTFTLDVLRDRQNTIQGVVHVDGTARLQTVSVEDQPLYYELIHRFYELTGVPVVLNTSFNLAGEPIVCSPYDALRTFFTCGMDALIIGKYLVVK
ncbi:MAG: carbamoyltransferase [Desulfobacteraceae bacterium]|jgi:carbamoyltransferase